MAIIYSYPTAVPKLIDKILITQSYNADDEEPIEGNPTRAALISDIVDLTGVTSGTANTLPIFTTTGLADSPISVSTAPAGGTNVIKASNVDRFIIDKPSSVVSGDPEYLITQDGNYKVSMGWDDDGAGFGYLYNWAGNGWRFGSVGNNPELTIVTTSGSEGVTVANNLIVDGKVGVGTSTPADKLHVMGTVRSVVSSGDGNAFMTNRGTENSACGIRWGSNNSSLILKNSTDVIATKISSWGNSYITGGQVGFGTTTPSAAVDIVATVENSGLLLSNVGDNSDYDSVRFTYSGFNAGSPEFIFTPKTQPSAGLTNTFFRFKTNGGASVANVANVSIDGKLGVGTTTPLANLDVKETTTNVAGQIIVGGLIASSTDDTPFGKLCFANTAAANSQPNKILASIEGRKNGSSNRGILTFGMADGSGSNWEKMRIDSYGYVGIGTPSPQRELDVAGDVRIAGALEFLQQNDNTFVGTGTGNISNTTGVSNVALGFESLNNNTGGNGNTALGRQALYNTTGNNNTGTGSLALFSNTTGLQNTGIGRQALQNVTVGVCNVGVGHIAGSLVEGGAANTASDFSVFLGGGTKSKTNNDSNQIVIGHNAIGEGTNTARIGNTSVSQLHVGGNNAGVVLKSPNGTAYIIKVTNAGALTVTAL